jgi:hypothetical protein
MARTKATGPFKNLSHGLSEIKLPSAEAGSITTRTHVPIRATAAEIQRIGKPARRRITKAARA